MSHSGKHARVERQGIPDTTREGFQKFVEENAGLQRVALLKAIEANSAKFWESTQLATQADKVLQDQLRAVVLESNMAGIEEFGERWFQCVQAKMDRMTLCADWIVLALEQFDETSGFEAFERALIAGAARMLPAYHQYYLHYLKAVQDEKVVAALKAFPPPPSRTDLYSHYTGIKLTDDGELVSAPIAVEYAAAIGPLLDQFSSWIQACIAAPSSGSWSSDACASYVAFLEQYRAALAEAGDAAALEAAWVELDNRWMDTKMPIQLVHDIETGYGDPLRVKATPDMSLRFLDEAYAKENAAIADIQHRLMKFYEGRDTKLARRGLKALSNTMAGIYFIPFKTGGSLQFSFSGQSIPNREQVKEEKGVKIFFDPVETAARVEINKKLIANVYHDAEASVISKFKPDAVEQLVWHVAAHEVGHAIYNLAGVAECFSEPANETMLEEPRAELTAMFTLKLLHEQGVLDRPKLDEALAHFVLDGLRYFDKYDSQALWPYIIFQIYNHKVCHKHGYLKTHEDGKLVLDESKTLLVLDELSACFLRILNHMDAADGAALESILFKEMAPEDAFVKHVVGLVKA